MDINANAALMLAYDGACGQSEVRRFDPSSASDETAVALAMAPRDSRP
jgi:hypothetical protein